MANQAPSTFRVVTSTYGTNYVPVLVQNDLGGFDTSSNAIIHVEDLPSGQAQAPLSDAAYSLACIGTNVGTNALNLAAAAYSLANTAYNVAVTGSGSGSPVDVIAIYNMAVAGTELAYEALQTAWSGTRTGDQALATAWAGTNEGNSAISLANKALVNSYAGTAAVPLAGGTMTGNLHVPQAIVGVGAVPAAGTVYYDMVGPGYQTTTVNQSMVVSAKNITAGAEICAVLASDGTPRAVLYDGNFAWFGTQIPYTSGVAGEKVLVALAATGVTASTVIAATTKQI